MEYVKIDNYLSDTNNPFQCFFFFVLKRLTFLSRFVDFWRERVARGGCFAGVYFYGKNVSDLGGGILRLLVYFQYFLYLCRGFVAERGNVGSLTFNV